MEYKGDKGCDYKSHPPLDHSKSLNDFKSMGIPIYAPYLKIDYMSMNMGEFTVKPLCLVKDTIPSVWNINKPRYMCSHTMRLRRNTIYELPGIKYP